MGAFVAKLTPAFIFLVLHRKEQLCIACLEREPLSKPNLNVNSVTQIPLCLLLFYVL